MEGLIFRVLVIWSGYSSDLAPMKGHGFRLVSLSKLETAWTEIDLQYATKDIVQNLTNNGMKVHYISGLNDMKSVCN